MPTDKEKIAMAKCEHHDDYVKMHDTLRDHIGMVERTLDSKITTVDKKVDTAFRKLDDVREDLDEQGKDHRETATYVKQLYKRFDELAQQMQNIVTKLDAYITTMASVKVATESNAGFNKRGKDLVYEVIKWAVFLALASAIAKQ